jgi:hydrogenase maturation protease
MTLDRGKSLAAVGAGAPECRTLVLGLGNPILGDDGVGLRVVERLGVSGALGSAGGVDVVARCVGGLDLLFSVVGYDDLIVVDARQLPGGEAGAVEIIREEEMGQVHLDLVRDHWLNLPTSLELGRRLRWRVPGRVRAVIVDVGDGGFDFGEELSEAVAQSVPVAVEAVLTLLREDPPDGGFASEWTTMESER